MNPWLALCGIPEDACRVRISDSKAPAHEVFRFATPQRREGLANRVGFATDCHTRDFFRSDGGVWRQRQQQQQQQREWDLHYRSQLDHGTGSLQHHELGNYIELDAARRACGVLQRDRLHHLRERRLTRHFNYHQLQRNRPVARDKV